MGMDLFDGYGPRGLAFLKTLFSWYARRSARASELLLPGQLQRECWERVSVALHKALGRQLVRFAARSWEVPLDDTNPNEPSSRGVGGLRVVYVSGGGEGSR